jgi:GDPmannose 4,6-dehydratase
MPRALVTGITGQDGQHLAELLHGEGYEVFGMVKGQNNPRIAGVLEEFPFIEPVSGDLADLSSLVKAVEVARLMRCTTWVRCRLWRTASRMRS